MPTVRNKRETEPAVVADNASRRPWTYHNDGRNDWIEDALGDVIMRNVGYLDGPLVVACVNAADACGTTEEAITEDRARQDAEAQAA